MIWFAIAAHIIVYILLGMLLVRVARRRLPEPFNQPSLVIPFVVALGLLLILGTLPNWHLFQHQGW